MDIHLEKLIEQIQGLIATFGLNIVAALAILIIGIWAAKLVRRIIGKALQKRNIDKTLVTFLVNRL